MSFLVISAYLHNTLCVMALFIMIFIWSFWISKRLRELWEHYSVVKNGRRNVLLLESSTLQELRHVLHKIHSNIEMNARQIRRLLRSALDENVVRDVQSSASDLHLDPKFTYTDTGYRLDWKHYLKDNITLLNFQEPVHSSDSKTNEEEETSNEEDGTSTRDCQREARLYLDLYFGVPGSYLKDLSDLANKNKYKNEKKKRKRKRQKSLKKLSKLHRLPSTSVLAAPITPFSTNTETNTPMPNATDDIIIQYQDDEGGMEPKIAGTPISPRSDMTYPTSPISPMSSTYPSAIELASLDEHKPKKYITFEALKPTSFSYHEFLEVKDCEPLTFAYDEIERCRVSSTTKKLRTPLGSVLKAINRSPLPTPTSSFPNLPDANRFFCVILSYLKYEPPLLQTDDDMSDEKISDDKPIVSNMSFDSETSDIKPITVRNIEIQSTVCLDDLSFLEISVFDMPNSASDASDGKANRASSPSLSQLHPKLSTQILADFELQRLVKYYDIFGLNSWKSGGEDDSSRDCKICLSAPAVIVALPCRHCCVCYECFTHIDKCPMCRTPIKQSLRWGTQPAGSPDPQRDDSG